MMKIKICGLKRPEDIEAVNEVLPDYMGFVFWGRSRRCVSDERAEELAEMVDKRIKKVGVFVDDDPEHILRLCKSGVIDVIQLHGSEDADYIRSIRKSTSCPVIKAFNIDRISGFGEMENSPADHVMADPGKGDGITFDWQRLKQLKRPFFLAGGLNALNVADAIEALHPYAVDVSSGVETGGVKDRGKMIEFALSCRRGT